MTIKTSDWLKSAIIYEVFPRNHTQEGNIQGITRDLERIRELGVDIVWLMPVYPVGRKGRKGKEGSPYAIRDYRSIDPALGTSEDFKKLVDKAHRLKLKVIIDVVFNHTAIDSVLVKKHPEWFYKTPEGEISRKIDDWSDIVDLDFSSSKLKEYLIDTLQYWVDLGVDGFRCDVAALVPLSFWKEAREQIKTDREIIWLAESVEKSFVKFLRESGYVCHSDPELHEVFDLTYDYDGFEYLKSYFKGQGQIHDYINHLYIQETLYPENAIKMRFLENHDNVRIASIIKDKTRLKNWTAFYLLLPGASLIYSGQEYGIDNTPDLFNQDPIDWETGDPDFYSYMKRLVSIARKIKSNCYRFSIKEIVKGIIEIKWQGREDCYLSLLNLEDRYGYLDCNSVYSGYDMLNDRVYESGEKMKIEKNPLILKLK
ncbi:alpha-amylase family glycosyl hydrolase [Halothermothrix orenii]|uniref:Alpha amylase n=1 Tax=Halothermothrix orenii (strain H 168 / OCM 544 / DSM 9562) TaxID=373903 RepID=B8CWQ7_HALOH|nr:alpha-amylase family glycosyl hydrolase [Halothermothrix orenii]ACL69726.1 alpha amylase [Halothermothrix orenii H 168]